MAMVRPCFPIHNEAVAPPLGMLFKQLPKISSRSNRFSITPKALLDSDKHALYHHNCKQYLFIFVRYSGKGDGG